MTLKSTAVNNTTWLPYIDVDRPPYDDQIVWQLNTDDVVGPLMADRYPLSYPHTAETIYWENPYIGTYTIDRYVLGPWCEGQYMTIPDLKKSVRQSAEKPEVDIDEASWGEIIIAQ